MAYIYKGVLQHKTYEYTGISNVNSALRKCLKLREKSFRLPFIIA